MGDVTRERTGLLRTHRDFRLLWSADAVSQFGTRIEGFALPMLALLVLDADTFQVGLLRTLQTAAVVLVGLPAGAWCDRSRSRPILIAADLVRFVLYGTVPLAAVFGLLGLGQLYVVVFVAGGVSVFFDVAQRSWLPRLVGRDHLIEANTRLQGNQSAAAVSASALAGGIVQVLGAPVAVLTDAASYLASALLLRGTRTSEDVVRPPRRPLRAEIAEGLRFVLGHPLIRPLVLVSAGQILFQSVYNAVSTVFLVRQVHLSAGLIGVLSSTAMLGALAATFTARWLLAALSRRGGTAAGQRRGVWLGAVGLGTGMLAVPFTEPGWGLAWYVLGDAVMGYSIILANVVMAGLQQSACPDHLLGRMAATSTFVTRAVIPVGSIVGGLLGTVLTLRPTIALAAIGTVGTALLLITLPSDLLASTKRENVL